MKGLPEPEPKKEETEGIPDTEHFSKDEMPGQDTRPAEEEGGWVQAGDSGRIRSKIESGFCREEGDSSLFQFAAVKPASFLCLPRPLSSISSLRNRSRSSASVMVRMTGRDFLRQHSNQGYPLSPHCPRR